MTKITTDEQSYTILPASGIWSAKHRRSPVPAAIPLQGFVMKYLLPFLLLTAPAYASDKYIEEDGNAITLCRGALPAYENGLRSRPLAVVNEGDKPSFVNCGWRAPINSYGQEWVAIVLTNITGSPKAVGCTGIFGKEDTGADYIPRGTVVPAHGQATIKWYYGQDNGGDRWQTNTSAQCLLPSGVGVARTPQGYRSR